LIRLVGALGVTIALAVVVAACGGGSSSESASTTASTPAGGQSTTATASSEPASVPSDVPDESWTSVGGDITNTRYSTSTEITPENAPELKLAYSAAMDPPQMTGGSGGENNPIEVEGVLYAASSSSEPTLGAYEAETGKPIWQKTAKELGIKVGKNATGTRGLAIGEGKIFVDEPGGILVAVDAKTGALQWKTLINTQGVEGYSQPTPVYWNGHVYIGQSGSDIIGSIRGFLKAIDAKTGKLAWTFHTIPAPGTPAAKTWASPKELPTGGGAVWTNVSVDPELGLVYVPVGNPWPDYGRGPGDELYTDSLVALDEKTGKVRWYYQTTHHDEWDYDCPQPPTLWEEEVEGKMVKGLSLVCKSGYVYELDRETGKPVTPVKEMPLANAKTDPQAKKRDEKFGWLRTGGKTMTEPIPVGAGVITPHCANPKLLPTEAPDGKPFEYSCAFSYYSSTHYVAGQDEHGTDWQPASYDPELGYTFNCSKIGTRTIKIADEDAEQTSNFEVWPQEYGNGESVIEAGTGRFTALNLANNHTVWQHVYKTADECNGGSAAAAGGVVFTADSTGHFYAYDGKTGKIVWTYTRPGLSILAPPIIYTAEGTEYVTVAATVNTKAVLLGFTVGGKTPAPAVNSLPAETQQVAATSGQSIFSENCGSCHTMAAAESTGTTGPDLDELKPDEGTVEHQVINGGGRMPAFKGNLSTKQIKAVSEYVAAEAGNPGGAPESSKRRGPKQP
jgi:alcohol dehydrogenase (cytochrome c)